MKYDEQCAIHPSFIHSHSFTPMASVELPVNLLNWEAHFLMYVTHINLRSYILNFLIYLLFGILLPA